MSFKSVLKNQRLKGGSLIAFNVQNISHLQILRNCAKELNKPVIAQFSARYIPYWEKRIGISHLVQRFQKDGIFFHLDHCKNLEQIKFCVDAGFSGVMFDGSSMPIEENVKIANEIWHFIRSNNKDTLLEVELGAIVGMEDGFAGATRADYYKEADLDYMVNNGQFDILALAIGNAHGIYESTADVKPKLLKKATNKYPNLHLVLHGGTGLSDEIIRKCIRYGVIKINVSTELKIETQKALQDFGQKFDAFNENNWESHLEKYLRPLLKKHIQTYTES